MSEFFSQFDDGFTEPETPHKRKRKRKPKRKILESEVSRDVAEHALNELSQKHEKRLQREMREVPQPLRTGTSYETEVDSLNRLHLPAEAFDEETVPADMDNPHRVLTSLEYTPAGKPRMVVTPDRRRLEDLATPEQDIQTDGDETDDNLLYSGESLYNEEENDRYSEMAKRLEEPQEEPFKIKGDHPYRGRKNEQVKQDEETKETNRDDESGVVEKTPLTEDESSEYVSPPNEYIEEFYKDAQREQDAGDITDQTSLYKMGGTERKGSRLRGDTHLTNPERDTLRYVQDQIPDKHTGKAKDIGRMRHTLGLEKKKNRGGMLLGSRVPGELGKIVGGKRQVIEASQVTALVNERREKRKEYIKNREARKNFPPPVSLKKTYEESEQYYEDLDDILKEDKHDRKPRRIDWPQIQQERREQAEKEAIEKEKENDFPINKLRRGEITHVPTSEIFPERYKSFEEPSEKLWPLADRWDRLTSPEFLQIQNEKRKTVEDVWKNFITTIVEFLDTHTQEIKEFKVAWQFENTNQYLLRQFQYLLDVYPKTYFGGSNLQYESLDDLLRYVRDGFSKILEFLVAFPRDNAEDSPEIKERKNKFSRDIDAFYREAYKIINKLPSTANKKRVA